MHRQTRGDRIFVYGMLLVRAPEKATLPGYRLEFDGFADVVPDEDSEVLGGVITCSDERPYSTLAHYDGIEGVDHRDPTSRSGLYRREWVELADGTFAWVYRMNRRSHAPYPPSSFYLDIVRDGYERHGHDEDVLLDAIERPYSIT